ncbi:hypothetical protein [Aurantimonas endophytica]|uniref:Uncharacterized protein n=1 Tax=Aurantimonas endophytica TaxID=1522175 RepID=A0A7W6HDP8_9HYPH|nr:hypothetical protein [Aurantimonas endophytica]MBB4003321.1 hypothetical protein [Aurantimonas endophytica]MCO6404182.1 hypothetical protein [Aurantimonas endophytica]
MLRSSVIAATLIYSCLPAGNTEPLLVRTVTLGGVTGAAYYSRLEQGYRFVGGRPPVDAIPSEPIALSSLETEETPEDAVPGMEAEAAGAR